MRQCRTARTDVGTLTPIEPYDGQHEAMRLFMLARLVDQAGNECSVCGSALIWESGLFWETPFGSTLQRRILRVESACMHWGLETEVAVGRGEVASAFLIP
jgi:hypothetical protein